MQINFLLITYIPSAFQVKNVNDHTLDNRMESFFLAETTKYLFLLFDTDNWLHNDGSSGVLHTVNGRDCVVEAGGYIFNTGNWMLLGRCKHEDLFLECTLKITY